MFKKIFLKSLVMLILVIMAFFGVIGCSNSEGDDFVVPDGAVEITDSYEGLIDVSSVYSKEIGWETEGDSTFFFRISVNDGDTLYFDFSEKTKYSIYLLGDPNATWSNTQSYTIEGSGLYMFKTESKVSVRLYLVAAE